MKNILIIVSLLFFVSLLWRVESISPFDDCESISSITTKIPIENDNKGKWDKLKEAIGERKIVVLGESTHFDENTFNIKSELVQLLNKEMGYDVLLFEAGLYDMWQLNEQKQFADPITGLYYFWCKGKSMGEFWNYVREKNITLGGFDVQLTGQIDDSVRGNNIKRFLLENIPSQLMPDTIDKFLFSLSNIQRGYYQNNNLRSSLQNNFSVWVDHLKDQSLLTHSDTMMARYIQNTKDWFTCSWTHKMGSDERFHQRDSLMADNLFWLLNNFYQNRKIIIWTANLHAIYDNSKYSHPLNFVSMGERLKKRYRDSCYTIVLSNYAQKNIDGNCSDKASSLSLEYKLHQMGYPVAFIDFTLPQTKKVLNSPFVLRANQDMSLEGRWSDMIDGLLFINYSKDIIYE